MLLKFLVTAAVLLAAWMLLFRGMRSRPRPEDQPRRELSTQTLTKCPACGIYLPEPGTCSCNDRA